MRISGAPINIHTARGVIAGVVRSDVEKYRQYPDQRMKMSRRVSTTSRPIITCALWKEICAQYLQEISSLTKSAKIPDELILNLLPNLI